MSERKEKLNWAVEQFGESYTEELGLATSRGLGFMVERKRKIGSFREPVAEYYENGSPKKVCIWLTFVVGPESADIRDEELEAEGEELVESMLEPWRERGFDRSIDEYLDRLRPSDPRVAFISRVDVEVESFEEGVELISWALGRKREFDVIGGEEV